MSAELDRIRGIERQQALLVKTINAIREKLVLEDDPIRKIRFEEQLLEKEGELRKVQTELQQLLGIQSYTGQSVLAEKIVQLGIGRALGNIDLVNCNRDTEKERFWDYYDDMEAHRFQFYCLTSCSSQKPDSFAERMLYEYLNEELEGASDALHYATDESWEGTFVRPKIVPLPVGRNLVNCQKAFRKYFAAFWKLSEQQSMEEYLKTGLPLSKYDAVALFFHIDAARWKEELTLPYLQWIINTLQTTHPEVPRILFFLKINCSGAHLNPDGIADNVAFRDIKTVLAQHPGVAHLLPFEPIKSEDLKRWFFDLNTRFTARLDDLITAFSRGLGKSEQQLFVEKKQFNMDDIELLQNEVYKVINGNQS